MPVIFRIASYLILSVIFLPACSDSSDMPPGADPESPTRQGEMASMAVNIRQIDAWNNLDAHGESAVNNYPFVRIGNTFLSVFEDYDSYKVVVESVSLPALRDTEWDHTAWDTLEVVQSSPTKVHLEGSYSRVNKEGVAYETTHSLRIVTSQEGRWGIKVRSTYPRATPEEISDLPEGEIAVAESAALDVLGQYIEARNSRNSEALADLHHYPSIVLLDVVMYEFNTREEYITFEENTVMHEKDYAEWDHTNLESVQIIHSGLKTVHLAIDCTDTNVVGESCGTGEGGVWVVSKRGGRWGIHARSLL